MAHDLENLLGGGRCRPAPHLKLLLRPERGSRNKSRGVWHIVDGARSISTGCSATRRSAAERALWLYEIKKMRELPERRRSRTKRRVT